MADTWDIDDPQRPRARPERLAPGPLRPEPRPSHLAQVPAQVLADATVPDALPMDRTSLIGLFDGPKGSSALLRLADGSVVKVVAGQAVGGGRVTAIDQRGLRLQSGGEELFLTLPS